MREDLSSRFLICSDTNSAVHAPTQKMARSLLFQLYKKDACIMYVAKIKAVISCTVAAKLVSTIDFANAKSSFVLPAHLFDWTKE